MFQVIYLKTDWSCLASYIYFKFIINKKQQKKTTMKSQYTQSIGTNANKQGQGGQTHCLCSWSQVWTSERHRKTVVSKKLSSKCIQPVSITQVALLTLVAQNTHQETTQRYLYSLCLNRHLQVRLLQETTVQEEQHNIIAFCGVACMKGQGSGVLVGLGNISILYQHCDMRLNVILDFGYCYFMI